MINSLDIESRLFVDRLYQLIIKPDVFHKLLFLDDAKDNIETRFCLKMHKIKVDPLQLPILYHEALLSLFELILTQATESIKNSFKLKLTQTFRIDYFFNILAMPDIFSNTGIQPQLNFILKDKIHRIVPIFLEKTELTA
jgi:hypothetical protein